jgi:superfamily II DNA or RNA helicase/ribosomal protein L21E
MPFFTEHKEHFILQPTTSKGLRKCQLGAIWALKSYFTAYSSDIAALVSLPTGSGKTALMMAACFELEVKKVLIIVPSKILRRQLWEQFSTLQILKDIGCLPADTPGIKVVEISQRITNPETWEQLIQEHDVVIAHPNSISPYYKDLSPLPSDLIDAVFIDEAHHEPAVTWTAINNYYRLNKRVFFTATPFRRDKKRMQARMAYHYPLEKALDDQILRPVEFQGTPSGLNADNSDDELIKLAFLAINKERKQSPTAAILIRTDKIEKAEELVTKYRQADSSLALDVVHSKRSDNVNAELIQKVKDGRLDGLICVGVASEGLDIPILKVAVLHATPRSIPYTIQFLGRISRTASDQEGPAILIANTDEVKGKVSQLYKSDIAWSRLIPAIVDAQLRKARHYSSAQWRENDFELPELNVFFSVLVYETDPGFQFVDKFEEKIIGDVEIVHLQQQTASDSLVVITASIKPIDWASRLLYMEDVLDIHIFYHIPSNNLLFELTTSEKTQQTFRKRLLGKDVRSIPYGRLFKVLSTFKTGDYIMVGMKNAVMTGASQPSYKTLMGSSVQSAIRASEGRTFGAGHALLRVDNDNAWGVATKRGRIWAMKRGALTEFQGWCDDLGNLMQGALVKSIPNLDFLATTIPIAILTERPMAVLLDDWFFRLSTLLIDVPDKEVFRNEMPSIQIDDFDQHGVLHCTMTIDTFSCPLIMDFNAKKLWTLIYGGVILVRADRSEEQVTEDTLENIINDYPSTLVMPAGFLIIGRNQITPNREIENLPAGIWKIENWANCNITSERYDPKAVPPKLPVINEVIEKIRLKFNSTTDVVVLDDGSHEVADVIWINSNNKAIHFIHCKPSSQKAPGCRTGDSDILFAQALRSVNWISSTELLRYLDDRLKKNSQLILGQQSVFDDIRDNFVVNGWQFHITLAQPGFQHSKVSKRDRNNNNVYEFAIPVYERIISCGASFDVWCS